MKSYKYVISDAKMGYNDEFMLHLVLNEMCVHIVKIYLECKSIIMFLEWKCSVHLHSVMSKQAKIESSKVFL